MELHGTVIFKLSTPVGVPLALTRSDLLYYCPKFATGTLFRDFLSQRTLECLGVEYTWKRPLGPLIRGPRLTY